MSTKGIPGQFDCYANALPDELMFVLLARDPDFFDLVGEWAVRRLSAIHAGTMLESDRTKVTEALECAIDGAKWRKQNSGAWRR